MNDVDDIKDCAVTEGGGICANEDFTDPKLFAEEVDKISSKDGSAE